MLTVMMGCSSSRVGDMEGEVAERTSWKDSTPSTKSSLWMVTEKHAVFAALDNSRNSSSFAKSSAVTTNYYK